MNTLKKFGPLLVTIGGLVATAVSPALSAFVASHKTTTVVLLSVSHFLHAALPSIFGDSEQVATPK